MDNDPSQSGKVAMKALQSVEGDLLKIPARSPDLNLIENIFHIVKSNVKRLLGKTYTQKVFYNFRKELSVPS